MQAAGDGVGCQSSEMWIRTDRLSIQNSLSDWRALQKGATAVGLPSLVLGLDPEVPRDHNCSRHGLKVNFRWVN